MIMSCKILVIILILIVIILITFEDTNVNKKENTDLTIVGNYKETMDELNSIIGLYINNFIYANQLAGGEIFIDEKRRNNITIEVTSEILVALSPIFRKKLNIYLSSAAIDKYITLEVTKIILTYANRVNTPQ